MRGSGGVIGGQGACVPGGHAWQGACMSRAVHGRGCAWQGGMHGGGHVWQGVHGWVAGGVCVAGETAAAGGTHPTGMHSC